MVTTEIAYFKDYYCLWSIGRIGLIGGNIYDQDLLRTLLSSLGIAFDDPLSGNVPWLIWVLSIFSVLPFSIALVAWQTALSMSLIIYLAAMRKWLLKTGLVPQIGPFELLFCAACFSPILNNFRWGQTNFIAALGLSGFLLYWLRGNSRAAGLSLSLILIKPHLQIPLLSYVLVRGIRSRRSRDLLCWLAAGFAMQLLLSFIVSPASVLAYPGELLRSVTISNYFYMPSPPLLLARLLHSPAPRYLLPSVGAAAGALLAFRLREISPLEILCLLSLGLVVCPYCWSHTFLLLFPVFLYLFCKMRAWSATWALLAFGLFGLFQYCLSYDPFMSRDTWMVLLPVFAATGLLISLPAGPVRDFFRRYPFEVEDMDGFPRVWRRFMTDYLRTLFGLFHVYDSVAPVLASAMRVSGSRRILDLCSGSGGPAPRARRLTEEALGEPVFLTLSDKFVDAAMDVNDEMVSFFPVPLDATNVPPNAAGFRTLFTSFHHFCSSRARKILESAVCRGEGIAIFEITNRSPITFLIVLLTPIYVLALTPFMRPFSWKRLLWTYLVPVVPLTSTWDGIVSNVRSWSPRELHELTAGLGEYCWKTDVIGGILGTRITFLIGYRRTPSPECAAAGGK